MVENEVKFKVKDIKKMRSLLIKLGAKPYPKTKETDYSFDTPDGFLSRQGKLLRLRKIQRQAVLTFKGPRVAARFKKREEINIKLDNFKSAKNFLCQIGFVECFNKEKIRQSFRYGNIEITFDKLPFIGYYLEIEGKDSDILKLIKKLNFNLSEAINESYNQLFQLFCIVNQDKIKCFKRRLEFSFRSEREFKKIFTKTKRAS